MPREVIVLQHEPGEGAGTLLPLLPTARIVRIFAGESVPGEAEALVVLGGGMSAYDPLPHLRDEVRLIRKCVENERPVLGICLGSQLLASALGGTVARAPRKEIGFYRVRLTEEAKRDALFSQTPDDFVAFHWHGDAFKLPPEPVAVASSTMTPLQAFRSGAHAWGIQFHLEVDAQVLDAMLASEDLGDDAQLLRAQAERELPRLQRIAAGVFSKWTALL
ncbi:MAG: type 1 glutamine amidotransferase [Myxococcales bacterium]